MVGIELFVVAALVLVAMGMLADRVGADSRDWGGDADAGGTH